jgi:hypothetical protein
MKFSMPCGGIMEIITSQDVDWMEVDMDEEIEGVFYFIEWNGEKFPCHTKTRLQATAMAFGAQWAANEMYNKMVGKKT